MPKLTQLADVAHELLERPALVVGPSVTTHIGALSTLNQLLQKKLTVTAHTDDYLTTVDQLIASEIVRKDEVREEIQSYFLNLHPSPQVTQLLQVQWSAIISLASDMALEDELRLQKERVPSSVDITLIDHSATIPSNRTIPIYKLLGNARDSREGHSLSVCQSDLLLRQASWSAVLTTLPDRIRHGALIFVGTNEIVPLVRTFLSALFSLAPPHPSKLAFLKDELALSDPTIHSLVTNRSTCFLLDTSIREFCEHTEARRISATQHLSIPQDHSSLQWNKLKREFDIFSSIIDVVPPKHDVHIAESAFRIKIVDALFRPTTLDWTPFLCELDLSRTVISTVETRILEYRQIEKRVRPITIVLRGEAGIGKTTALKHLAVDLASQNICVLWCRRPPSEGWGQEYVELGKAIQDHLSSLQERQNPAVVVVYDYAWAHGMSPFDLSDLYDRMGVPIILVLAVRNSDFLHMEATGQSGSRSADDEYELPFLLDSDELERLPQTLVAVGAAEDIQDAQNAIHRIPTRNATDILCSLWYLVPYTRGQITASLQDEYCRLGMSSEAIRALASLTDSVNSVARTAYEFVAVCSNLNIGVPLEVLVHGLRVSYSEWLTMCVEGNPIWGLLYDDLSSDDSVIYSTRNEVVTRVLVDLVNGGLGHTGEYNRLKTLVSACQIGTPVYRTFLHELLVKSRAKLNGILSFEQGLELYEMAET